MASAVEAEKSLKLPICSSCGRLIPPFEKGVRFKCPNCGEATLWRCKLCRKLMNPYICPRCGFRGP